MCEHSKYVHNKYIHKSILVSCGKCAACLQQKANARAQRIRNHNDGRLCLFLTLTYDNRFVPYVPSSELINISDISSHEVHVYRDFDVRFYKDKMNVFENKVLLTSFLARDFKSYCYDVPILRKKKDCVGIIYWVDVQNFIKRLRINLKRSGYEINISYFAVGEYGSGEHATFRPHFHLLVYLDKITYEEVRPFIVKSWPYGDMQRKNKRIQIAIDASGYVASYVSKSANLPKICESSPIRQKHSHSLYFGANLSAFSLPSLLAKADSGDMSYNREILKDGKPVLATLPIPKYVINRYFPKFKGYSSFSPSEVRSILSTPIYLWYRLGQNPVRFPELISKELTYSKEDYRRFIVHLHRCLCNYIRITGKTVYDYAIDYERVWFQRFNFVYKHSYDDISGFFDFYENINEYIDNLSDVAPTLTYGCYVFNPNERSDIKKHSRNLSDLYLKKEHIKQINSFALSSIDEEF